jgi:hypothetical protein
MDKDRKGTISPSEYISRRKNRGKKKGIKAEQRIL